MKALISVSDKTGIVEFATRLEELGWDILSTGGTARALKDAGLKVTEVSEITGFPEMLSGRVKTLHPMIGGLLNVRDNPEHQKPRRRSWASTTSIWLSSTCIPSRRRLNPAQFACIENIDIGGPTMLRSAAKNFKFVTVVTDPADYQRVLDELANCGTTYETRYELALKVSN